MTPPAKKRVLFVCIGNACRSQMAEGFARTYGSDVMIAASAGLMPAYAVAPQTIRAMDAKNIDLRDHFPKSLRHLGRAEFEEVGRDLERRTGRIDVRAARDVLLQDIVLHRAGELGARSAASIRDRGDEREEDHRGRVDGHGERDLVERDVVKQPLHVVERRDRDAHAPDLAQRALVVGVVAHLRREVERHGEPRLAERKEVVVALVRRLGGPEARVLAHGPEARAVHRWVDTAEVGRLAGMAERAAALRQVRPGQLSPPRAGSSGGARPSRRWRPPGRAPRSRAPRAVLRARSASSSPRPPPPAVPPRRCRPRPP